MNLVRIVSSALTGIIGKVMYKIRAHQIVRLENEAQRRYERTTDAVSRYNDRAAVLTASGMPFSEVGYQEIITAHAERFLAKTREIAILDKDLVAIESRSRELLSSNRIGKNDVRDLKDLVKSYSLGLKSIIEID